MWIPFSHFLQMKRDGTFTPDRIKKFLNEVASSFSMEQAGLLLDLILVLFMHSQFEQSLAEDLFGLLGITNVPAFLFEFAFQRGKPFTLHKGGVIIVNDPVTASFFAFQGMVKKAQMRSTLAFIVNETFVNAAFFFALQIELTKAICANPSFISEPQRAPRLRATGAEEILTPADLYLIELAKKLGSKRFRFSTTTTTQSHKRLCAEGSAPGNLAVVGDQELHRIKLTPCAQKIVTRVNAETKKHPIHEERMLIVNTFFPFFGQERTDLFLSWVQNTFFPPSSDADELKKRKTCLAAFRALIRGFINRSVSPSCCHYAKKGLCFYSESDTANLAVQKEVCYVKARKTSQGFSPRLMVAEHLF